MAVLMGGWSSERPVSLSSGESCAEALEDAGYRVTRVDVGRDIATVLQELKPDVAFNALHGPFGEDGTIQGILEFLDIPYTHSGVLASALAMNKEKAKIIAKAAGIPVAQSRGHAPAGSGGKACDDTALCGQAGRGRLVLRRPDRARGHVASAAGTLLEGLAVRRHRDGRTLCRAAAN